MIYVYRQQASDGARELAMALQGRRWRGLQLPIERKARRGDVVVCWGEALPNVPTGVRVLNGGPIRNKLEDALALAQAGVPTITVSRTRPATTTGADPAAELFEDVAETAKDFSEASYQRDNRPFRDGLAQLIQQLAQLQQAVGTPLQPVQDWLGRATNHVGGNDLLTPTPTPQYWVRREQFVQEFRIHSFQGRSIRAGIKAPREDMPPTQVHPWIRSWDGGWRIRYDGVSARQAQRDLAHQAVRALGLDFGAVDIGQKADGGLIVLEVNRAPGLAEGTIDRYTAAIQGWINGTPATGQEA